MVKSALCREVKRGQTRQEFDLPGRWMGLVDSYLPERTRVDDAKVTVDHSWKNNADGMLFVMNV